MLAHLPGIAPALRVVWSHVEGTVLTCEGERGGCTLPPLEDAA